MQPYPKFFRPALLRWLLYSFALACLVGVALLALLWQRHNRAVILPEPGGPYPVGRVTYDWTDTRRADPLAEDPGQPRKLNVWIWYPADPDPGAPLAPYLPAAWAAARQRDAGIGWLLAQNPSRVRGHSYQQLAVSPAQSTYPVLIVQPGLGPILPDYTSLCEALASYGYIVVGSTPTGSASVVAFNDGQVANRTAQGSFPHGATATLKHRLLDELFRVWAGDDRFVLDRVEQLNAADPQGRFSGRMDLQAVGILGHSFGGASAAEFCRLDARCKAGVDLDGYVYGDVIQNGLHQPFLFVWGEPEDTNAPHWQQAMQDASRMFEHLPPGSLQVTLRGARHFNFTDQAVEFAPLLRLTGALGSIDGAYGLQVTTNYVRAFFDRTLRNQPAPLLEAVPPPYPEVEIKKR